MISLQKRDRVRAARRLDASRVVHRRELARRAHLTRRTPSTHERQHLPLVSVASPIRVIPANHGVAVRAECVEVPVRESIISVAGHVAANRSHTETRRRVERIALQDLRDARRPARGDGPWCEQKTLRREERRETDVTTPALGAIVDGAMSAARCSARSHARTGGERSINRASGSGVTRHLQEKSRQARQFGARLQRGRAQPQPRMPNASRPGSDRNSRATSKPRFRPHRTLS
jgi:hypothetical protein